MKKILRWFIPVVALLALAACSKERDARDRFEFDAEWAAAYYYGADALGGVNSFQLDLAQGRTDEDLDLISSGAVVRLLISAPLANSIALPDGLYQGSATPENAYTFYYGSVQADKSISGSYVGVRTGKQTQFYPIEQGKVSVVAGDGGQYEVRVEVRTDRKSFSFSYLGAIQTFDCTAKGK